MNKRPLVTVGVLLGGAFCISCVSPFYGTARIEKGFLINAGIAGSSYMKSDNYVDPYYKGIRGDLEIGYGICKYFQCNFRTSLGLGLDGKIYRYSPEPAEEVGNDLFYDLTLTGFACWPTQKWNVTPAIGIEGGFGQAQFHANPLLLLGLGNPEFLTLGTRLYGFVLGNVFTSIHISRFNIFMGLDVWTLVNPDYRYIPPVVTLGVGYKVK